MAVFGVQVVISMIVASFLHKVFPYYSFGRWLITFRLKRYQSPSDSLLRPHVSVPPSNTRSSGGSNSGGNSGGGGRKRGGGSANQRTSTSPEAVAELRDLLSTPGSEAMAADIYKLMNLKQQANVNRLDPNLAIPKSANIKLEDQPIRKGDLLILHYSEQLEWMINITLATILVHLTTVGYYHFVPGAVQTEYNLSTIWLVLVLGYVIKVLASLTGVYFSEKLATQRSVGIVFTMLFFVCALGILLIDEGVLDFGLEKSHKDLSLSIAKLIGRIQNLNQTEEMDDHVVFPMWVFKISVAIVATSLSSVLIFSGFRFADIHFGVLRYFALKKTLLRTVLHICYIAPMFCLSLWIRPLSHDVIAERNNINLFGFTEISYEKFRFWIIISICLLRLVMYNTYMQSFLESAKWRALNLRREQGRITIKDFRDRVHNVFEFYPATGAHYLAPFILLLALTIFLHISSISTSAIALSSSEDTEKLASDGAVNVFKFSGFGVSVFHGCISFLSWWICFIVAVTTGIGPILREFVY